MKGSVLLAGLVMLSITGCSENTQQPPDEEVFEGILEVEDLIEPNPTDRIKRDEVRFTVRGTDYRIDHLTDSTGICGSGGEIGGFGSNRITLSPVFTIPAGGCDSARIPRGQFKASFRNDSLIIGTDTLSFPAQDPIRSYAYTFRLSK